jgi:hypothetical protein
MSNTFAPPSFAEFLAPAPAQHDAAWAARVNFHVGSRFDAFVSKLQLTELQAQEAATKVAGIVRCLNREYWGIDSTTEHCIVEGSWGKGTQTRPPRDVDILFVLPYETYQRFEGRVGNKQSQLLQEVKGTLEDEYETTEMRGDGQVVMVKFANGHGVEVVPAFELQNGQYWICDTHDDGSYKTIDPKAEIAAIEASDVSSSRTTRELVKMLKRWQRECNVGDYLKSFQIELVAIEYLKTIGYSLWSRALYDYVARTLAKCVLSES